MGPDGVVNITMRKELEEVPEGTERDAKRIDLAEMIRENIDPYVAAGHGSGRRRHRPGRDPRRDHRGAARQPHQAGAAPVAQARSAAGLTALTSTG